MENILTWEWQDRYTLRSSLYPYFLSIPLHILKFLKIDYNILVVNSMLFMNTLIIVVGDYFLYQLSKIYLGKRGASITLLYTLFNFRINQIFLKTLTNGVESVFCTIGFYYFSILKPKLDWSMVMMTFSITVAFIVRSSSLIGFIPLALFKIFQSWDYFVAVLQSGFVVALPTIAFSILCDSLYYGKWTCP